MALLTGALTGRWRRYEIADVSMQPTLADGDWTIGVIGRLDLRAGDVVTCGLPGQPGFTITKRIESIDPTDGTLWLAGDNPAAGSVDSRTFGPIDPADVEALLLLRYKPWPPKLIR